MKESGNIDFFYRITEIMYKEKNGKNYIVLKFEDRELEGGKIFWKLPKDDFNKIFENLDWNGTEEDIKRIKTELDKEMFDEKKLILICSMH